MSGASFLVGCLFPCRVFVSLSGESMMCAHLHPPHPDRVARRRHGTIPSHRAPAPSRPGMRQLPHSYRLIPIRSTIGPSGTRIFPEAHGGGTKIKQGPQSGQSEGFPRTGLFHPWARWDRGPVAGKKSVSSSRDRIGMQRVGVRREGVRARFTFTPQGNKHPTRKQAPDKERSTRQGNKHPTRK